MKFVCPKPRKWNEIYQTLYSEWRKLENAAVPPPPIPLIRGGWIAADESKNKRWNSLLDWATRFGFAPLVPKLREQDKHYVTEYRGEFVWPEPDKDPADDLE